MKNIKKIAVEFIVEGDMKHLIFERCLDDDIDLDDNIYIYKDEHGIQIKAIINSNEYCFNANRIDKLNQYREATDTIIQLFIDEYNRLKNKQFNALEDGVEYTNEDEDNEDDNEHKIPYDPNSIRVTQGRFSLKEIVEMINGSEFDESILDLSPDFQRNFVWDIKRKSRLIESILLQIPLPVFYLARDSEGKYQVVDGAQRLTVISDFFNNKFRLKHLEYLNEECENKYFFKEKQNSLLPKSVRALRSYQIDCNIIEPDTPYKVKLDIFKRLNTGGRSLNRQEIRNAILKKNSRQFIKSLAESDVFRIATNNGVKPKRMMDQELIIRFVGFYLIYNESNISRNIDYNGKMDEFLDEVVDVLNDKYDPIPFTRIESDFYVSMKNAIVMFEDYAFRKIERDFTKNNKNMINKSLFTCFSVLLCNYKYNKVLSRGNILKEFADELKKDKYLYDSITYATNDSSRVDTAFLKVDNFLKRIYGE